MNRTAPAPAHNRSRSRGPGRRRRILLLAITLVIGTACTSTAKPPAQTRVAQARPRSTASVSIEEPAPGAELSSTTVRVRVALTGGEIVYQTSTELSPTKGHIHLTLDGKLVSMVSGLTQDVPVKPGLHLLEAEYVASDHLPFEPRVLATVTFTVK
jgi:hypothetical protein